MPQFRLAIGYRTEHRNSEPVVLAGGYSPEALQGAINTASPDFLRFELGVFQFTRPARRTEEITPELRQAITDAEPAAANLIATIAVLTETRDKLTAERDEALAALRVKEAELANVTSQFRDLVAERDLLAEQLAKVELTAVPSASSNPSEPAIPAATETPASDVSPDASEAASAAAETAPDTSGPDLDSLLHGDQPSAPARRKK